MECGTPRPSRRWCGVAWRESGRARGAAPPPSRGGRSAHGSEDGIGGREGYRPDLALMYLPTVEAATGALIGLRLAPMRIRHFRLSHAARGDAAWLRDILNRESRGVGVRVRLRDDGMLAVHWE